MTVKTPVKELFMREKHTEQKLIADAKARGGLAVKFVSPGFDGIPDRAVLLPSGHIGLWKSKPPAKCPARSKEPGFGF